MKKRNGKATRQEITYRKSRFSLTMLVSVVVFLVLLCIILVIIGTIYILYKTGIWPGFSRELHIRSNYAIALIVTSVIIGLAVTYLLSLFILRPLIKLINCMNELASGNFKTRLSYGTFLSSVPSMTELCDSFNKMASELDNTEILRSDFVNDFSHEFKTPIVSISGFAKLLMNENLSEESKREYIRIIGEESQRLAALSENVLNMTRIDKQTILTDISEINISEQIRHSVLLLENKWVEKNIFPELDLDEYYIYGNEELLIQVWINLIDNGIKFSERNTSLAININESDDDDFIHISFANTGVTIKTDDLNRIFNKFYQADKSHATAGNGVGLAVVKKIVDLHKGKIDVESADGKTVFTVSLPKG